MPRKPTSRSDLQRKENTIKAYDFVCTKDTTHAGARLLPATAQATGCLICNAPLRRVSELAQWEEIVNSAEHNAEEVDRLRKEVKQLEMDVFLRDQDINLMGEDLKRLRRNEENYNGFLERLQTAARKHGARAGDDAIDFLDSELTRVKKEIKCNDS